MGSLQASNWRFDVREAVNRAANRGVSPDANQGGGFGLFIKAANIKAQQSRTTARYFPQWPFRATRCCAASPFLAASPEWVSQRHQNMSAATAAFLASGRWVRATVAPRTIVNRAGYWWRNCFNCGRWGLRPWHLQRAVTRLSRCKKQTPRKPLRLLVRQVTGGACRPLVSQDKRRRGIGFRRGPDHAHHGRPWTLSARPARP
jgi:hypothetical protein